MKLQLFSKNKDLNVFVVSQLFSIIGERISIIAFLNISDYINKQEVNSYLKISTACGIIPVLLLSFVGGHIADKYNRKIFLITLNILRAITIFAFLLFNSKISSIYYLSVAIIILLGIFTALSNPIKKSTIPFLTDNSNIDLTNSNNLLVTYEVIAMILGLGFGTLLSYYFTPFTLLLFDAFFFLLSIVLLSKVKLKYKPKIATELNQFVSNKSLLNFIIKDKNIFNIFLFIIIPFYLSAGLFYAGATIWAANHLKFAGRELSIFFLLIAIGAILSFIIVKRFYNINQYKVISISKIFAGLLIFLILIYEKSYFLYPILFFFGLFIGCLYNLSVTLLHKTVTPNYIGRVMSISETLFGFMFILGAFIVRFLGIDSLFWNWTFAAIILLGTGILIKIGNLELEINEFELGERSARYLQSNS